MTAAEKLARVAMCFSHVAIVLWLLVDSETRFPTLRAVAIALNLIAFALNSLYLVVAWNS